MTLIELLVAFIVFIAMVAGLVALATAGLDTWTAGEGRKDVFDRAQRVLDQLTDDLRNTYADEEWHLDAGGKAYPHAGFVVDRDTAGVQRLRLVRTGGARRVSADAGARARRPPPPMDHADLWEVAYVMDSDAQKPVLHRALRYFDRGRRDSLLNAEDLRRTDAPFFRQHARELDTGVLWIGYRLWTQSTTAWAVPGEKVWVCARRGHPAAFAGAPGNCPACGQPMEQTEGQEVRRAPRNAREIVGPSLVWDSSRVLSEGSLGQFILHRRRQFLEDPDFVYPEIVQVTIVVESQASDARGTRVTASVAESDAFLRLDSTTGMPDGPDFVKVGAEWVEYAEKALDGVRVKRRGARGTKAAPHAAGERARFGDTFTTDVHVPVYREAVR